MMAVLAGRVLPSRPKGMCCPLSEVQKWEEARRQAGEGSSPGPEPPWLSPEEDLGIHIPAAQAHPNEHLRRDVCTCTEQPDELNSFCLPAATEAEIGRILLPSPIPQPPTSSPATPGFQWAHLGCSGL